MLYQAITLMYVVFCFSTQQSLQDEVDGAQDRVALSCLSKTFEEKSQVPNQYEIESSEILQLPSCSCNDRSGIKYWYTFEDFCAKDNRSSRYFAKITNNDVRCCTSNSSVSKTDCLTQFQFTKDSTKILNASRINTTGYVCSCQAENTATSSNHKNATAIYIIRNSVKNSNNVNSNFYGTLTTSSPIFSRPFWVPGNYYYRAINVSVSVTGDYRFVSNSSMDTYGCFYNRSFYSWSPETNLIAYDDDGAGAGQFSMHVPGLQRHTNYILVVTTYRNNTFGAFTVVGTGPGAVNAPFIVSTTTTRATTTTNRLVVNSNHYGSLSTNSPSFSRPSTTEGYYYYQAVTVSVSVSGTYRLVSSSSMDTYGYLYNGLFSPSRPSTNLITQDDDGAGDMQFSMIVYLQSYTNYILVVTTHTPRTTGSFAVSAIGPSSVQFRAMSSSTQKNSHTSLTIATMLGILIELRVRSGFILD